MKTRKNECQTNNKVNVKALFFECLLCNVVSSKTVLTMFSKNMFKKYLTKCFWRGRFGLRYFSGLKRENRPVLDENHLAGSGN